MERMKDLTQQYVEQLENMVKDLREKNLELEEENKKLKEINESQNEEIQRFKDNAMEDMRVQTKLEEENKNLKEDVDYFRQCYLDLKKLCEKEGFMLSDEEVTKMFNLDKIK